MSTIRTHWARVLILVTFVTVLAPTFFVPRAEAAEERYTDSSGRSCVRTTTTDPDGAGTLIDERCTNPNGSTEICNARTGTGERGRECGTIGQDGGGRQPGIPMPPAEITPESESSGIIDTLLGREKGEFVPLTNLPGIEDAAKAESFPNFLNMLYRLCIGAAAVIAILQIMRAGAYFMFNKGSVAHNEQGKSLIQNSVFGLLLVLSPAIVFGIINPDILKLNLDVSELQPDPLKPQPTTADQKEGQAAIDSTKGGAVTGSVLQTATFPSKAGADGFVNKCSALVQQNPGIGSSKGCTKTCSPAGSGTCDAEGCSQYTAYCSAQQSVVLVQATDKAYGPHSSDQARYAQFQQMCAADGGSFKVRSPEKNMTCPGASTGQSQDGSCFQGYMRCDPK